MADLRVEREALIVERTALVASLDATSAAIAEVEVQLAMTADETAALDERIMLLSADIEALADRAESAEAERDAFAAMFPIAVDTTLDPADVVGTWDAVAETPEGDMPAVLTIAKEDGALAATMDIGGMERQVTDVVLEGHTLEMTVMYDGVPYDVELEVDGDSMTGTYTGSMASGPLTATRQP